MIDDYIKIKDQIPCISELFLYNGSITKTKKNGNIGEGFYATKNPFFAALKSNDNKLLGVNQKAQIIFYKTFYNNSKVKDLIDESFKGKPIEDDIKNNYGINHALVGGDSKGFIPIKQEEKERYSITAEEFAFSNNIQIIPLCLLTVMRKDHFILWKDDKFNDLTSIKKDKDALSLIKLSRKMEVNVYFKHSVDEALNLIKNKKYSPFKLITKAGKNKNGKYLIENARKFTRSDFVCLVYATNIDHMKWISKMTNVLFTLNSIIFLEFAELKLNEIDVLAFDKKLREDKNFAQLLKTLKYNYWKTYEKELLNFGDKNSKASFLDSISSLFHKK